MDNTKIKLNTPPLKFQEDQLGLCGLENRAVAVVFLTFGKSLIDLSPIILS